MVTMTQIRTKVNGYAFWILFETEDLEEDKLCIDLSISGLFHIFKVESWCSWLRTIGGRWQIFPCLADDRWIIGTDNFALTTSDSNQFNRLTLQDGLLESWNHFTESGTLIKRQSPSEHLLGSLLATLNRLLQLLNKWHGLLRFAHLTDLGRELLYVDDLEVIEALTDQVDILGLPFGEGCGGVDRELLGLLRIECNILTL
jgi:hypothetical protein